MHEESQKKEKKEIKEKKDDIIEKKEEENNKLEVNDIMKILKKKVLEGEINIKYDESEDIIEIYDIDPGLKERVKKSTDLYQKIMEGNKNNRTSI